MSEGKRVLRKAFKDLEREVPDSVARGIRGLRHPKARLVRIPLAVLSIVGGLFSFLPILGVWMLPLGLLLLAYDVPALRKPVGRFTSWGVGRWAKFRGSAMPKPPASADAMRAPDRPHLSPIAMTSAANSKPNPADPLSNPSPTPDIVPPEAPPEPLPNEPPFSDTPGTPTPMRPPSAPDHPLGPPEPMERRAGARAA